MKLPHVCLTLVSVWGVVGCNSPVQPTPRVQPKAALEEKIAFESHRDGNGEIYVMNTDGSGLQNLTNDPSFDIWPAWSPDGTRIAFSSDRDGLDNIYVMNADGSGLRKLTNSHGNTYGPVWSPDGSHIAFASNRNGRFDLGEVPDARDLLPHNLRTRRGGHQANDGEQHKRRILRSHARTSL